MEKRKQIRDFYGFLIAARVFRYLLRTDAGNTDALRIAGRAYLSLMPTTGSWPIVIGSTVAWAEHQGIVANGGQKDS